MSTLILLNAGLIILGTFFPRFRGIIAATLLLGLVAIFLERAVEVKAEQEDARASEVIRL